MYKRSHSRSISVAIALPVSPHDGVFLSHLNYFQPQVTELLRDYCSIRASSKKPVLFKKTGFYMIALFVPS
ncbi:hypothetical protein H6F77_07515 [Microcoleus sp. FACHB-831]|uniref:hypothetical protein n=1 Tax=Microcoleus sp. FACHB-831 TaxID=2692827 RepID=UPI00168A006F|nr:hypothetical protein [Microcoleus sp. FACHB-831]MBD1920934.1 hypothetical protein [Microcoleus sp. FACHB-831]